MTIATARAQIGQPDALYRVRKGVVEMVDVPRLGYVLVDGSGPPGGERFTAALQGLYAVSYAAHFLARRAFGEAPPVMPLEGLWWIDDDDQRAFVEAVAAGRIGKTDSDRDRWRWRLMIMQPEPIDSDLVDRAIEQARTKRRLPALWFEQWREGRSAQLLHVGPYAEEGPSIVRLHQAIIAGGYQPHGRHHEIYLGDPRRSAPARLRTILRQPVVRQPAGNRR